MKKIGYFTLAMLAVFSASQLAYADSSQSADTNITSKDMPKLPYQDARKKLKAMDPEKRVEFTKNAREKWSKLSEKDKQAFAVKVKDHAEAIKKKALERCEQLRQGKNDKILIRLYTLDLLQQEQGQ